MGYNAPKNPIYAAFDALRANARPAVEAAEATVPAYYVAPAGGEYDWAESRRVNAARGAAQTAVYTAWRWTWSFGAFWRTTFNSDAVRDALGLPREANSRNDRVPNPPEARQATVNGFTWLVTPQHELATNPRTGRPENTSRARVFLVCDCGRNIPAGRVNQHRCAAKVA